MKYGDCRAYIKTLRVAPHWGAWIEIRLPIAPSMVLVVAPHWGAWIEICPLV